MSQVGRSSWFFVGGLLINPVTREWFDHDWRSTHPIPYCWREAISIDLSTTTLLDKHASDPLTYTQLVNTVSASNGF